MPTSFPSLVTQVALNGSYGYSRMFVTGQLPAFFVEHAANPRCVWTEERKERERERERDTPHGFPWIQSKTRHATTAFPGWRTKRDTGHAASVWLIEGVANPLAGNEGWISTKTKLNEPLVMKSAGLSRWVPWKPKKGADPSNFLKELRVEGYSPNQKWAQHGTPWELFP